MKHAVAVAWNWEHDEAFVSDLERRLRERGFSVVSVTPANVERCVEAAAAGQLTWGALLDRAWESDRRFRRLNDLVTASGTKVVNPPERSLRMGNKAAMHALLAQARIPVPRQAEFMPETYVEAELSVRTAEWARPLWMKPANSGGGDGVLSLERLPEKFPAGAEWQKELFVLQEGAAPLVLGGRPAWFRVFYVFGTIHAFWWHPTTHVFAEVTPQEMSDHGLACVPATIAAVATVAGLEIFSSEVSLVAPGVPLVVDPVNDPVDFRRRSHAADAVPDEALAGMISAIASGIAAFLHPGPAAGTRQ